MQVISDTESLAAFCQRQAGADFVTVDTEFIRDTTYWPKLCLVQVGGPEEAAAIDPLADGISLEPLLALLGDTAVTKVFHAARQDLEIFYQLAGKLPTPVFDTQVAAMVCGFGDQVSYEKLAGKLAGAQIDKSARFADWGKRPLTKRQLEYALSDVTHLRKVYEKLRARLDKNGRAGWLQQEMDTLTRPATYDLDPQKAWQRLKTRSRDRRYLALLRALATWRESEAQQRDVPRNRVLRDEQLFDIAAHAPGKPEELARTRGLNQDFARGRLGRELLEQVAAVAGLSDAELPPTPPRQQEAEAPGPLVDLLKVLLKLRCDEHDVAQKLVANSADIEQIALDDEADVAALQGWRFEVFGRDALALKHGKIALAAVGGKARTFTLESTGDKAEAES